MGETGLTKDTGYQIGVRRTIAFDAEIVCNYLFSDEGLSVWLGEFAYDNFGQDKDLITKEGVDFRVTSLKDNSHLRLKWKKDNWIESSILQMRIIPGDHKRTISFHQEKL
jgi:hypothetical protein